jgi:hypothetical protein
MAASGGPSSSNPASFSAGRLMGLLSLSVMPALTGCASGQQADLTKAEENQAAIRTFREHINSGLLTKKCEYPSENVGKETGDTVEGSLTWEGYADGATETSDVSIMDYHDCSGRKGINAILAVQSATWCGVCQAEAQDIAANMKSGSWPGMGIRVLTLMIQDADESPATLATALNWRNEFDLSDTVVAADPSFSFEPSGTEVGLPVIIVIDPRDMQVLDVQQGASGEHNLLESLAEKNAQ